MQIYGTSSEDPTTHTRAECSSSGPGPRRTTPDTPGYVLIAAFSKCNDMRPSLSVDAHRPHTRTFRTVPRWLGAVLFAAAAGVGVMTVKQSDQAGPSVSEDPTHGFDGVATFSILGYDPDTGEMGAAVQSRVFSVGNGVIWAEAGVGVVATQAVVDVSYGPQGLGLLKDGLSASEVAEALIENDPNPDPAGWPVEGRQFAVMDATGSVAVHTGPGAPDWAGHRVARYVSAQGNILAGPEVVDAMVDAFQRTDGHLSVRLLAALEAGQAAGGDTRGMQSAAMLIVKEDGGVWLNNDVVLRLQVDDHPEPIAELARLVSLAARQRARLLGGE